MVAKSCKQDSCRNPWASLFPNGEVTSLELIGRQVLDDESVDSGAEVKVAIAIAPRSLVSLEVECLGSNGERSFI